MLAKLDLPLSHRGDILMGVGDDAVKEGGREGGREERDQEQMLSSNRIHTFFICV